MIAILADDLTGAADSAARCHHAGLAAAIALAPPAAPLADVTAFTSDSRHLPPAEAAERVHASVAALRQHPGLIWYKKIDSTLRGNLGSELDALLDALGRMHAVVCPAFPAQCRGLQDGTLVTSRTPTPPLHLPSMLAAQSRRRVAMLPLTYVRAGVAPLAAQITAAAESAALLVVDGASDEDLRTIIAATEQALPAALLCGSAGLVGALAARHATPQYPTTLQHNMSVEAGPALLVVGSGSTMARRQITHAQQHGVRVLTVGTTDVTACDDDTLLCLPEALPDAVLDGPAAREWAEQLAEAAIELIARQPPALLVLTGGDTAMAVLRRLGVARLDVAREVLPGIPLTRGAGADGRCYSIVLKAGNHGDEAALVRIMRELRN